MSAFRFLLIAALALNFSARAQQTVDGFEAPESVVGTGRMFIVSNIGLPVDPMKLDSNGFLSLVSQSGVVIQEKFSRAKLNAPKGLAVIGDVVYTADVNRIVGFAVMSGVKVFEVPVPGSVMLNDLCRADNQTLVVSESVSGKIYRINIKKKSIDYLGSIPGANGVTFDAKTRTLYACGMGANMAGTGKLYAGDITGKDTIFRELPGSPAGMFDGLEMTDDTHLIATDWTGGKDTATHARYIVYGIADQSVKTYGAPAGPADLWFDKATGTIALPLLTGNKLLLTKLSDLKPEPAN